MLVALNHEGKRLVASQSLKVYDFRCPQCLEKVNIRVGTKRIPHFAHVVKTDCKFTKSKRVRKKKIVDKSVKSIKYYEAIGQGSLFDDEEK